MMNWGQSHPQHVCVCLGRWGTGRSVRAAAGSNAGRRAGDSGMTAGLRIVEI